MLSYTDKFVLPPHSFHIGVWYLNNLETETQTLYRIWCSKLFQYPQYRDVRTGHHLYPRVWCPPDVGHEQRARVLSAGRNLCLFYQAWTIGLYVQYISGSHVMILFDAV